MYHNYYPEDYYCDYLMHYGVKGMKWGHRKRYYDSSGNLNARGIKKYAKKGYSQDSYNSNKTRAGKIYDKVTNAHKHAGDMMYDMSSQKVNKARAEKYVADQQAKKEAANTPEAKAARRKKALKVGAAVAGTALAAYGAYKTVQFVKNKNVSIQRDRGEAAAKKFLDDNKIISSTWGFGDNDMTLVTAKTRSGNSFQFGEKVAGNTNHEYAKSLTRAQERIGAAIQRSNEDTEKRAAMIRKSFVDSARNDSLGTAAKNVTNHYVTKAKDELNRRRR